MKKEYPKPKKRKFEPFKEITNFKVNGALLLLRHLDKDSDTKIYCNNLYQVSVREKEHGLTHLSIRAIDQSDTHDWRDFQRIKNELCSPTREAVEIYPKEEFLVDTANQYHLWVFPEEVSIPFGFKERAVADATDPLRAFRATASQRPFYVGEAPEDAVDILTLEEQILEDMQEKYGAKIIARTYE